MIIVLFSLLTTISISQKAFIMSSSVGYYNYRQQANAMEVYQLLKKHGYEDQHMLLVFPQNIGCCPKNMLQGSVSFRDGDYTNLNNNVQIDYKYYTISAQSVANTIGMKYPPETLNLKRLKIDKQPYFLYITGHGGDFYFKIRERMALITQNFEHIFKDFSKRMPQMPVFVVVDSCSAITPYEDVNEPNIIILASSSLDEKSLSKGYDKKLNCPKSDQFTFYLSEYLEEFNPSKTNSTIQHLHKYMDFKKLKVHSKIVAHNKLQKSQFIHQYMTRKPQIFYRQPSLKVPEDFLTDIQIL